VSTFFARFAGALAKNNDLFGLDRVPVMFGLDYCKSDDDYATTTSAERCRKLQGLGNGRMET